MREGKVDRQADRRAVRGAGARDRGDVRDGGPVGERVVAERDGDQLLWRLGCYWWRHVTEPDDPGAERHGTGETAAVRPLGHYEDDERAVRSWEGTMTRANG